MTNLSNTLALKGDYAGTSVSFEEITPAIAKDILSNPPTRQRPTNARTVGLYASQMRDAKWSPISTIHIDKNGACVNGLHRLRAVVLSGVTCVFIIVRDAPEKSILTMDIGRGRGYGDILNISCDVRNKNRAASISQYMFRQLNGKRVRESVSPDDMVLCYTENRECIDIAARLVPNEHLGLGCGAIQFIHAMLSAHGVTGLPVDDFFEGVGLGIGLGYNDSRGLLRSRLSNNVSSKSKLGQEAIFALTISAWNSYAKGETRKTLKANNPRNYWENIYGYEFGTN